MHKCLCGSTALGSWTKHSMVVAQTPSQGVGSGYARLHVHMPTLLMYIYHPPTADQSWCFFWKNSATCSFVHIVRFGAPPPPPSPPPPFNTAWNKQWCNNVISDVHGIACYRNRVPIQQGMCLEERTAVVLSLVLGCDILQHQWPCPAHEHCECQWIGTEGQGRQGGKGERQLAILTFGVQHDWTYI